MSEQDNNGAEATSSDETQLDILREGIDDPIVLKEQLKREAEARRQLTARARTAEANLKTEREARVKLEEAGQIENKITNQPANKEDERLELRLDGYSKEEVDYIMANGGSKVLGDKNSFTAIAINTRREQKKAEEAASQTSNSGLADVEKQVNLNLPRNPTIKDLKQSLDTMEKVLPHAD